MGIEEIIQQTINKPLAEETHIKFASFKEEPHLK